MLTTTAVTLAGLLLGGPLGVALVRRELRQLDRVAATATRVAQLPLHRGEVDLSDRVPEADTDPGTEVGKVGAALNQLLGHVENALAARQASEMQVRRFVADASHELRTPLASIRGYAELVRRVPEEVSPDVLHAVGRVESEAVRMTTLVEDLLLLARLDAGRPLEREPVDLTALAADAVADAHAAGPDHTWRLVLADPADVDDEPTEALVLGDDHACGRSWPTCSPTPACTPRPEPPSSHASASTRAQCCSRSATTAPGSRRICRSGCSTGSAGATRRARREPGPPPDWLSRTLPCAAQKLLSRVDGDVRGATTFTVTFPVAQPGAGGELSRAPEGGRDDRRRRRTHAAEPPRHLKYPSRRPPRPSIDSAAARPSPTEPSHRPSALTPAAGRRPG